MLLLMVGFFAAFGCDQRSQSSTTPPPGPVARDLEALVQSVPLIIVGKVDGVKRGRAAGEGEARLQFNDVRITVERLLKGQAPAPVVVEELAPEAGRIASPEGAPYRIGERYVLFLNKGEGHRHVAVPQGRYLLRGKSVDPISPGPVADSLKGVEQAKFIEQVASIAAKTSPK